MCSDRSGTAVRSRRTYRYTRPETDINYSIFFLSFHHQTNIQTLKDRMHKKCIFSKLPLNEIRKCPHCDLRPMSMFTQTKDQKVRKISHRFADYFYRRLITAIFDFNHEVILSKKKNLIFRIIYLK